MASVYHMTRSRDPWEKWWFLVKMFLFWRKMLKKSCKNKKKYKNFAQIEVIKASGSSWAILRRCCKRFCWSGIWGRCCWRRYHIWGRSRFDNNAWIIITVKHSWSRCVSILFAFLFGFCWIIVVLFQRTYRIKHSIFGVIGKVNRWYYFVKWCSINFIGFLIRLFFSDRIHKLYDIVYII